MLRQLNNVFDLLLTAQSNESNGTIRPCRSDLVGVFEVVNTVAVVGRFPSQFLLNFVHIYFGWDLY